MMIPEVPVTSGQESNVRTHGKKSSTRGKATEGFGKRSAEGSFVRQVLEEVTGKDKVQRASLYFPGLGTILLQKMDRGIKMFRRVGIEIHRQPGVTMNGVNKFAIATSKIEHDVIPADVLLKKCRDQHSPNLLPITKIREEAVAINPLQLSFTVGAHFFM
jgi:hypothetical protein